MAKRIRIVTALIVPTGAWVLNATPNPGFLAGYYGLAGDAILPVTGSVEITGRQFLYLFDDSDNYIGEYTIVDLPPGFVVTSIAQEPTNGMPYGSAGGGLTTYPLVVGGGATVTAWDSGTLPLTLASHVYDSSTMSALFCEGFWILNAACNIPAGVTGYRAFIVSQTYAALSSIFPTIPNPYGADDIPLMVYEGFWTADAALCPVFDPLTDVQIVDPVTGEFSWTLPPLATGVLITLSQTGHDDVVVSVLSPATSYIPVDIYGNVTVDIKPMTVSPLCLGSSATLSLAITTPYEPFGPGGETGGIDLGGEATLQFIGDPSGIYTLVPGKTNDTLYERIPAPTSQVVKIPDPYLRTAFLGE